MATILVPDIFWYVFILTIISTSLGILISLYRVHKGEHARKETPIVNAIGAVCGVLFFLFYLIILSNWHV